VKELLEGIAVGREIASQMRFTLREDLDPDPDFYYHQQFRIYHDPYLIWDMETWEAVLDSCTVYRIEANGEYAGDVLLEDRRRGTRYIVDFSILPEYQRKGIGKTVLEQLIKVGGRLTAVTREETLGFFLNSGFELEKTMKNYYDRGVNGYYILFSGKNTGPNG
jgi:ribosomal protein S18 acetylase RimI-like enzyme